MGDAKNKTVHYKPLGFLHMGKILQLAKFFSITNTFNPYTPNKNFDHYHIQFSIFFIITITNFTAPFHISLWEITVIKNSSLSVTWFCRHG